MARLQLGYFQAASGNVGDDLNPWLAPRLMPDVRFGPSATVLIGIGSILVADRWDGFERRIVVGSGARSAERLPTLDDGWDVRFVRGPRTIAAIGEGRVGYIADPAILAARFAAAAGRRRGVGIVPYYQSGARIWQAIATLVGARIISPKLPVDAFLAGIGRCDMLLCEAMHGAILADALRIPWLPVSFQNRRQEGAAHAFKWSDWCGSMELPFAPAMLALDRGRDQRRSAPGAGMLDLAGVVLGNAAILRRELRSGRRYLSDARIFDDRLDRLSAEFERVNREFR